MLNKKLKSFCLLIFIFLSAFLFANTCLAAIGFSNVNQFTDIAVTQSAVTKIPYNTIIVAAVQAGLGLVSVGFFFFFIYGGFKWMTARGNEEQIREAKKTIVNAVIGL